MWQNFLSGTYLGNTGRDYLTSLVITAGLLILLKLFQVVVLARLRHLAQKTKNDFDDVIVEIIASIKPPFYLLISVYFGLRYLSYSNFGEQVFKALFLLVFAYEVIKAIQTIIEYIAQKAMSTGDEEKDEANMATIKTLSVIVKIVLWAVGSVLILANLGVDVSSLIAGLGIGGIAVALALQNILGDIFSSFSIIIDKPFQVGDFVVIGSDMGVVEKIGIKTTRLRTLQGEELVVSNKELTTARVQNFKKMERRRVLFSLGVIYETPKAKLEKIPAILEDIISKVDKVEFDRCHFRNFGDYSLNFEVVYYVESGDYAEYMDINQVVNFDIFEAFEKEGIEFAYPTQVEYHKG